jgi:glucosyl-3-phosphoglycerate synthase
MTRQQMDDAIPSGSAPAKKLAIFNLDHTILRSGFMQAAAKEFGFVKEFTLTTRNNTDPFIKTQQIARQLKGKMASELLRLTDSIAVTPNLAYIITALKEQGYITGIISDSYDCIADHIRNEFSFDFAISNELELSRGFVTGEVRIPSIFSTNTKSQCRHDHCKLNALLAVCGRYKVDLQNTMVIGDGENDICCIKKAGIGVSFCSTYAFIDAVADHIIKEPDFSLLMPIIN